MHLQFASSYRGLCNVQPRIQDLRIQPIDVANGRVAYVVTIPQATINAPHQAPDNKYYYRQNFQSVPMEDYQVRDAMRRATTPELFIQLAFASGMAAQVEHAHHSEISKPITLVTFVGNRSSQPAFHTIIQLGIDDGLRIVTNGAFEPSRQPTGEIGGSPQNWLKKRLTSPPDSPIFTEDDPFPLHLTLGCPSDSLHREFFYITTKIRTPGYSATERWVIQYQGGTLRLYPPIDAVRAMRDFG